MTEERKEIANEEKTTGIKQNNNSTKILIGVIIALLIVIIAILAVVVLKKDTSEEKEILNKEAVGQGYPALTYQEGVIATEPKTLQDAVDELHEKVTDGQMGIEMQVTATSTDGKNFSCYLANADENQYDMYMAIYADESFEDELLLTGLIPVGSRIESFQTNRKLPVGEYECYLVYTQVEDDHATIHSQVIVTITLVVKEA